MYELYHPNQALIRGFSPIKDRFSLGGAIVKRPKQLIPRHVEIAVIALKIAVMDLVVKHPKMKSLLVAKPKPLEPGVGGDSKQCEIHQVKDHMHGVAGDHEVNDDRAEIHQMLNRMHRQAGPWADIGVAMMHGMKPVKGFEVQ